MARSLTFSFLLVVRAALVALRAALQRPRGFAAHPAAVRNDEAAVADFANRAGLADTRHGWLEEERHFKRARHDLGEG